MSLTTQSGRGKNIKELKQETIVSRIKDIISRTKFLSNTKYYKTNKVSVANFDSWAARGQAGGCGCCNASHHIYTVYNKRHTTKSNKSWSSNNISPNLCERCFNELEKQCNYVFIKW